MKAEVRYQLLARHANARAETDELFALVRPRLYAFFETDRGEFSAGLYEKYTPKAVSLFIGLAQGGRPDRHRCPQLRHPADG